MLCRLTSRLTPISKLAHLARNVLSNHQQPCINATTRQIRSFSSQSSSSSSSITTQPPPSSPPHPTPHQHLIPPDAYIPPPPGATRQGDSVITMPVLFLGVGVGRFELEMFRGAPQLASMPQQQSAAHPQRADIQARFDLSAPRPTPASPAAGASANSAAQLKSSWASSSTAQADLTNRREKDPVFSNSLQFGADPQTKSQPKPLATADIQNLLSGVKPSPSPASTSSSNGPTAPPKSMPPNSRIIVHSSVVVYQSTVFCWKPNSLEEITAESLNFLRTLTPRPELILIGSGSEMPRRLSEDVLALLAELRIGYEVMTSSNAGTTFNILTDEGRTVLAALIKRADIKAQPVKLTRSQEMRKKLGYWTNSTPSTQTY